MLPEDVAEPVYTKMIHVDGVEVTDVGWYQAMRQSTGMTSRSVSQIKAQIQTGNTKVMSIYYVMILMLVITGTTAIGISLYSRIRMSSTKIAHLRAIGMSLSQMILLIIRQNAFYPVLVTIPQILYIKKQRIVEDLEKVSF